MIYAQLLPNEQLLLANMQMSAAVPPVDEATPSPAKVWEAVAVKLICNTDGELLKTLGYVTICVLHAFPPD